jgi:hypothetical protein
MRATRPAPDGLSDEDEPGIIISFAAPGRTVALWHWSLDLIRRVAGHQEPAWRCVEFLAAEFLSGVPDLPADGAASVAGASAATAGQGAGSAGLGAGSTGVGAGSTGLGAGSADPGSSAGGHAGLSGRSFGRRGAADAAVWEEAVAAARDALRSLGTATDIDSILAGRLPEDSRIAPGQQGRRDLAGEAPDARAGACDPWALDDHLRSLIRLRQSIAWRLGRLLRPFRDAALHRELGFSSLEDWCRESLGISPRRVRYLVSLDRSLRALPLLADAYRRGLVSWCQVRHLVRVVRPSTQTRWIRYARQVTVRRLEEAVAACAVAAALEEPGVRRDEDSADRQGPALGAGAPLPPREPAPGSAPDGPAAGAAEGPAEGPATGPAEGPAPGPVPGRHTSSPPSSPIMGLTPGPARHRIVFWLPLDVAGLWNAAIGACRRVSGSHLSEWECLEALIASARETWEDAGDPGWRRRYRIFERDGWRCQAPGCTSRQNLNEHHIVLRSQGGGDEEANLVTLCVGHHQQGVHEGRVRCRGRAPGGLWWELGVRPDSPPLARYFGDLLLGSPVALKAVGSARNPAP